MERPLSVNMNTFSKSGNMTNLPIVSINQSLKQAIRCIDTYHLGIAMVTDQQGRFVGVIVDGDIRRALINASFLDESLSDVVSTNALSLPEGYGNEDVVTIFQDKRYKERTPSYIPIVSKDGFPVDLISAADLAKALQAPAAPVSSGNVLVFGGAGYIGATLLRRLLNRNVPVTVLDSMEYGDASLDEFKHSPMLTIIKGDTRHIEEIVPLIRNASTVVHLAELVGDPLCAMSPQMTMEINYLATLSIAQICRHLQVNRFIYMSSCSVYGSSANPETILTEESELAPVSLYARTKINCEHALLSMADANFSPCIFRLGTVFGLSPRPRFDLVVNTLTAKAVTEGAIGIFGGNQWRPHIHVDDVARAIEYALDARLETIANQIFNVAGDNLTIDRVGELVIEALPGTAVKYEDTRVDIRNYRVSSNKINDILGFRAEKNVADGIIEIADAIQSGQIEDCNDTRFHNYKTFETRRHAEVDCPQH